MKKLFLLFLISLFLIPIFADEAEDLKKAEELVVRCKTVNEVNQAKQAGALFIQTPGGSYWVMANNEYKGPFKTLNSAVSVRKKYGESIPLPGQQPSVGAEGENLINPQLMLFPFVDITKEQGMLFTLPSGQVVHASEVMIHPSPFTFDQISYAPIDLYESLKRLQAIRKNEAPSPNALPVEMRDDKHFAVTGKISSKEHIVIPADSLKYSIGAAVVGENGDVHWKTYGPVEGNMNFKCVSQIPNPNVRTQFLLLFILAEGRIPQMLSTNSEIPDLDASAYQFHVLGAAGLEMGPNWFPPVDKATEEEFKNLMEKMKIKQPPLPNVPTR